MGRYTSPCRFCREHFRNDLLRHGLCRACHRTECRKCSRSRSRRR